MDVRTTVFLTTIFIFGVVVFWRLVGVRKKLKDVYNKFESIRTIKKDDYQAYLEENGDPVIVSARNYVIYDRDQLENNRATFNAAFAEYVALSQLITLFPMLGILGTVWGLVRSGNISDIDQLVTGLGMALSTTLVGLICAIFLKGIDSILLVTLVNNIETEFDKADVVINKEQLRFDIDQAIRKHTDVLQEQRSKQQDQQPVQMEKQREDELEEKSAATEFKEAMAIKNDHEKSLNWSELSNEDF